MVPGVESRMVNINKLKAKFVEKGLSVREVAEKLGVDRSTLYRKINDKEGKAFTVGEVQRLSEILDLTPYEITRIFFDRGVA